MSEEKKGFTVADRRRFTADGDLREGESSSPEEGGAGPQRRGPAAPPTRPKAGEGGFDRAPQDDAEAEADAADFGGFLMSLGAQASLLLGLEPGGDQEPPDLAGARSIIAILEMLKDKTEGRRTGEEDQILDGVLYELRMAYLTKSRGGA